MTGFHFGSLVFWDDQDKFGEIAVDGDGHANVAVWPEELRAVGVHEPQIGARFLFRIGSARRGTGAIDLRPLAGGGHE
jgi:hypothetical protein